MNQFAVLAMLLLAVAIPACDGPAPGPPHATPVDVAPADLWAAYTADEVAADARYKGRLLRVRGEVKDVGRKDGRPLVAVAVELTASVECGLAADQSPAAERLRAGDPVAVVGRCVGIVKGGVGLEDGRIER